jgi:hypothetical protein
VGDRGFWLQNAWVSSCGEVDEGECIPRGSTQKESTARNETERASEGVVGKGLKEEDGELGPLSLESGGWPVHAPSLMRRPLNSGGGGRKQENSQMI